MAAVPSPNKHQQRTEVTRAKLLAAAMRVFARDGFERSRLEDIAAEAGYTRGAFYANFSTKEDLFIALLEQQAVNRIQEIEDALNSKNTLEEKRAVFREFYLSRGKDRQWALLTLEFKLYALRHSKHKAKLLAAHERVRQSLTFELTNKLGGRPISPDASKEREAKILLEAVWGGLLLEHAYDPKRVSAEKLKELLGRMFDLVLGEDFCQRS
jgi:AcrR family transcriptional regulator